MPDTPRTRLVLTRRGRLVRTILVAVCVLVLLLIAIRVIGGSSASTPGAPATSPSATAPSPTAPASSDASDAGGTSDAGGATADDEGEAPAEMVHSGDAGDGTWTVAAPVAMAAAADGETVRTYALRTENGIGLDADATAADVAGILADARGWSASEHVRFEQVADPDAADFTISLASPPTVDSLCAPARTNGTWNCRTGKDVVLNSDRWLHMTPSYTDLTAYRTYMVNHEVGHYLGHGHEACPGEGQPAPVMLQQSMGLGGCTANPWPNP